MDRSHGQPVERSASDVRQLECGVQALSRLGEGRRFQMDFDAVSDDPDMEFAMVDATIVKVHRHAQGAKRGTQN